jgi:hypothetical protein
MELKRLIRVEAISQAQLNTLHEMHESDGLCSCGRKFYPMSPKFVLCNMTNEHPADKNLRGALLMAAYCFDCTQAINAILQNLKGSAKNGARWHKN